MDDNIIIPREVWDYVLSHLTKNERALCAAYWANLAPGSNQYVARIRDRMTGEITKIRREGRAS
jgi:hypothetical protein